MKICLITDQHFGSHKGSQIFQDYYKKFYDEVFFPYLKENKIKTLIDLGDTFDNRKSIDFVSLKWAKENYYKKLEDLGVTVHMIVGNHTTFYKNTIDVNTPELLLNEFPNVNVYSRPKEIKLGNSYFMMLPWICAENYSETFEAIDNSHKEYAIGHLELQGFISRPGVIMDHGMDASLFRDFGQVYSGHFHFKSEKGNIKYLGNPYQMYWNDYSDTRGFHELDLTSKKLKFIPNPYTIYKKIFYNDIKTNYDEFDCSSYEKTFVKVVVDEKTNYSQFDNLIETLYNTGVHDVKVVETFINSELSESSSDNIEIEDTLTLLDKYVEDLSVSVDKTELKNLMRSLYIESCNIVN